MSREPVQPDRSTVIDWLLEPEDPSVRYWALQNLMSCPITDPAVRDAREALQKSSSVLGLLAQQEPDGSWRGPRGDIWEEKGTVFSLLILGELGMSGTSATERALDHLHQRYQMSNGRLAYRRVDTGRRRETDSTWMWCVTAVALRAALLLGHFCHPLVEHGISFLEENYDEKGGWQCSTYSSDPAKVRPANCYMGTIKALSAFSLIPEGKRSKRVTDIIRQEIETCLENHVCFYRVGRKGEPVPKRAWLKFGFPRYWRSDALEAADVLTGLGSKDIRINKALEIIKSKQTADGRWNLDFSETKRAWVSIEDEGRPSKWITLRALRTLRRYGTARELREGI